MGLFTHTEATIQAGETALRIIGAGFIVSAVSVTSSGALEGLGKGTPSLLISLCRYVVVIIPAAFLLSRFFGAVGVWNAFWITEAITAIISICVYYKAISQSQRSQSTVKMNGAIRTAVDSPACLCRLTSFTAVLSLNCLLKCSIFSSMLTLLSFASAEQ